jgi:hypothetical protein
MVSDKPDDPTAVSDYPLMTEQQWYLGAVVSAFLTAAAFALGFIWIFSDGFDPTSDVPLAQALSPFGVAFFGLVTFCTVGWRGSINARQVDQSEREGRAKLLQEGAKLLGEKENPSHVSAGVATLELLITGPDSKLAVQAMNLVADYIQGEMATSHDHRFRDETFAALANGAKLGREASRTLRFSAPMNSEQVRLEQWQPLLGVRRVDYIGGTAEGGLFGEFVDATSFTYSGVRIEFFEKVRVSYRFRDCWFAYCDIAAIDDRFNDDIEASRYSHCDFSGCSFGKRDLIPDFRPGNSYFSSRRPPISDKHPSIDWENHLLIRS